MTFTASADHEVLANQTHYSIGGGFVVEDDGSGRPALQPDPTPVPCPFRTAAELLQLCGQHGLSIAQLVFANEAARRPAADLRTGLLRIWAVMAECVRTGCSTPGVHPGGLKGTWSGRRAQPTAGR